jgi:hypothetical protein
MQSNLFSRLRQLFAAVSPPKTATSAELAVSKEPAGYPEGTLGFDQLGAPIESPIRNPKWHCLILGATGSGKTSLTHRLLRNLNSRVIWLETQNPELAAVESAISRKERFELPVVLVVDDVHLFTEHLELIELVARDGRKSNVFLLVTAQLTSDLPQSVWRNCQIRFALGPDANEQLNLTTCEQLAEHVIAFSWPGKSGLLQIEKPKASPQAGLDQGNPLLRRASTPQLAPYEESAPARQTPLDQWSMEEQAEPQGLHDRQPDNTGLPHRTRYSRTL